MKTDILLVISRGVLPLDVIDLHTRRNCIASLMYMKNKSLNAKFLFFTVGGIFQPKNIQNTPISILMKNYIEHFKKFDPSKHKVLFEDTSLDTWQNIENFKAEIEKNNIDVGNIYIFADELHSIRVKLLLNHHGFKNVFYTKSFINLTTKEKIKEFILILMTWFDASGGKDSYIVNYILQKERAKRLQGSVVLKYE